MSGAIREYRLQPGTAEETICKIRDQFAPMVTNVPGFVGVYGRCCRRRWVRHFNEDVKPGYESLDMEFASTL
jgi:hypothetical protein